LVGHHLTPFSYFIAKRHLTQFALGINYHPGIGRARDNSYAFPPNETVFYSRGDY
jgi:hypothetical protein